MQYSRDEHLKFLEEELRSQTEAFRQKLETTAVFLLHERDELFVAQFLRFHEGEMILKFSNKRGLPRQGEYLYCFSVPTELRDYRTWGTQTYGDLIKSKENYTECICIWQAASDEEGFNIAGFRGVELEFAMYIQDAAGMILILGPNKPPFEYLKNLQKIVSNRAINAANLILDQDFIHSDWVPALLDGKSNLTQFIKDQLQLQDTVIIEGPPGTGKTHFIADLVEVLASENKSILVTALTNRALIEIVEKPALEQLLENNLVFKTRLSVDEARSHKKLQQIKDISPQPGRVILSTFYIVSSLASKIQNEPPFDYIIVDEASQALLAMFAGAAILGEKNLWIGDTKQLPPVISLNEDKINRKNYGALIDGLKALSYNATQPIFQLIESHRLTERSSKFTGIFYKDTLRSKAKKDIRLKFKELSDETSRVLNPSGGPTLIKTDLPVGIFKPSSGIDIVCEIVEKLLTINENIHISVLSFFVETTKALQKKIFQSLGYKKNLLIETVSRIQGLTTDVCIYLIPNTSYYRSLEGRVFNVATSRAKRHTLIIIDQNLLNSSQIDNEVKKYLIRLNEDFSFYITKELKLKLLS
jgi:DNA replication ATP-dependent helicase Dna2